MSLIPKGLNKKAQSVVKDIFKDAPEIASEVLVASTGAPVLAASVDAVATMVTGAPGAVAQNS